MGCNWFHWIFFPAGVIRTACMSRNVLLFDEFLMIFFCVVVASECCESVFLIGVHAPKRVEDVSLWVTAVGREDVLMFFFLTLFSLRWTGTS